MSKNINVQEIFILIIVALFYVYVSMMSTIEKIDKKRRSLS